MTALRHHCLVAIVALLVVACSPTKPPDRLDRYARDYLALVRSGQFDSALSSLDSSYVTPNTRVGLQQARDFLTPFRLDSAELVGWNVWAGPDARVTLSYQLHGASAWSVVAVTVVERNGAPRVLGLHWEPLPASLRETNAFTIRARSPRHYIYLGFALGAALLSVTAAVLAAVSRIGRWWMLVAVLGVSKFTINWATGATHFQPISVQLLSAGFFRPASSGPWLISFSLPLGAVLVLVRWANRHRGGVAAS